MDRELIFYEFSRSKVERGDFTHFLSVYSTDKLPSGRKLREMMDSMVFCIQGYDNDPREIHSIPEIRRFYAAFHDAWPYWLYFCNLEVGTLRMMVACSLNKLAAMKIDEAESVLVEFDPLELLGFLKQGLLHMNTICDQAQMFEHLIYDRTKKVFEYFGLEFNADPPDRR